MRKNLRGLVKVGLLSLWLIGAAANVGCAELAWQRHDKGNIALLNGDWPGQNRAVIDALAAALRRAGCQPTLLDGRAFMNPFVVSPERFDLLIVTGGNGHGMPS